MKTKLIALLLVMLSVSGSLMAQNDGKVAFGILGGVNLQNLTGKDSDGDKIEDNGLLPGFHAGFNVILPVAPDFYIQPGLLFSTKGAKFTYEMATKAADNEWVMKYRPYYVELPVNFLYRPVLGSGHMLLGFGPYAAYGVGGKVIAEFGDESEEAKIKFKSPVTEADYEEDVTFLRPLDAGANIFFGYELNMGLFFHLNAQLGLLKVNPEYEGSSDDDGFIKNTGFGLSLGYRF